MKIMPARIEPEHDQCAGMKSLAADHDFVAGGRHGGPGTNLRDRFGRLLRAATAGDREDRRDTNDRGQDAQLFCVFHKKFHGMRNPMSRAPATLRQHGDDDDTAGEH